MYRHTQHSGLISQADLNKIASMFQNQPTAKQLGGFSVGHREQMESVKPLTVGKDPWGFVYLGHSFGFQPKTPVLVMVVIFGLFYFLPSSKHQVWAFI